MIPTILVPGILLGVALRSWWPVPLLGIAWVALVLVVTDDRSLETAGSALVLGLTNAALGVIAGRLGRAVAARLSHRRSSVRPSRPSER